MQLPQPSDDSLVHFSKRNENLRPLKKLYTGVHSSFTYHSPLGVFPNTHIQFSESLDTSGGSKPILTPSVWS